MNKPRHVMTLAVAGITFCCAQSHGQPDVLFIDGGYAELCSIAAHKADERQKVEVTGSRLGISSVDVCTLAIEGHHADAINRAASYNNRGVLHFAMGSYAEALQDFEQAIRLNARMAQAHVNRGYCLVALMRWDESITAFDRGLELGAADAAKAHFNRGIAHEESGNLRQAYQDYQKAAELDPQWEAPRLELSRFVVSE